MMNVYIQMNSSCHFKHTGLMRFIFPTLSADAGRTSSVVSSSTLFTGFMLAAVPLSHHGSVPSTRDARTLNRLPRGRPHQHSRIKAGQ